MIKRPSGERRVLVMRTTEDPTDPIRKLISSQKSVRFHHLALAVNPLGLYGVVPRTLLRQQAAHDPYSIAAALFDFSVMLPEPAPDLPGDVPASVVPDENHGLLASRFELFGAPRKKPRRYGIHEPPIHESQPRLIKFGQIESVTGDGLRLGVVFGHRLLNEAPLLSLPGEATQVAQSHPAPPAFVQETHRPGFGIGRGHFHQPIASEASLFSFVEGVGGGDPPLGPLPSDSEKTRQGGPDGLPRDPPLCEPLLESDLRGHL